MKKYLLGTALFFSLILCTTQNKPFVTCCLFIVVLGLFLATTRGVIWPLFLICIFGRLLYVQSTTVAGLTRIGCRQNGQHIDILLSGVLSQSPTYFYPYLNTSKGQFLLSAYVNTTYKNQLQGGSTMVVSLYGKIRCLGPGPINPFSRESTLISKSTKGIIEKIYAFSTLSHSQNSSSTISNYKNKITFGLSINPHDTRTIGILPGILLGDTSLMTETTYNYFIDSGLIHLVSASGGNIALILLLSAYVCIFIPIKPRRYISMILILVYAMLIGENISFLRACCSFFLVSLIPRGYSISRGRVLVGVLCILFFFNPFLIISSWGLLLSIGGVYGLLYIFYQCRIHKITSFIMPTFFATISLWGPLFYLTSTVNILTIPLSLVAMPLVQYIIITYFLSLILGVSFLVEIGIELLYMVAYYGSLHGVYITFSSINTPYVILLFRICTRILLPILYHYTTHKYFTKRD